LKPEQGSTLEFGVEQKIGQLKARLVGFQNDVSSGIVFQSMDEEPYGQYQNIAKQKIMGIEAEMTYQRGAWQFEGNYTYLWSDTTYSALIRRPAHQGQLRTIFRPSSTWQIQGSIQYVGERKDLFFDEAVYASVPKNLASYFWTELQIGYQMSAKIRWNLLLKNVLNQEITELYGYTGQGRNVQLTCVIAW
jgi:outer membrane cobalamin receptor